MGLDFGASFHDTPCKDLMLNFRAGNFGKVHLVDDETLDIAGMEDINLRIHLGTSWMLKNVRYIPGLKKMLISVGQLDKEGYRVTIGDGKWEVIKENLVVARGEKRGTLYIVEKSRYEVNVVANEIDLSTLWHQRLGHMSEKGMKLLAFKGKIPEIKNVEVGFYEPCVLGKQKRVTFTKTGRTPKAEKLELVHTYVYGPTTVTSLGGFRYYVTFIDDSTKKVWVYFLKNKSDVFHTFKKWKNKVENQTGLTVKSLMSDNGGEYSSDEFKSYCAEYGIRLIKTIPRHRNRMEVQSA